MENQRQSLELADIFRFHEREFLSNNELHPHQLKAWDAIATCRTAELGGHIEQCDSCGHTRQAYNSCRNRHCPKCRFVKTHQWVDKLAGKIPPGRQFHLVFTIPACLRKLFYINQKRAYSLLFGAAWKTLEQTAKNPKHFGKNIGAVGILHTWGQTLVYHPHIHFIVPAGGLDDDCMEWTPTSKHFFLCVKTLSKVFRGILLRMIEKDIQSEQMKLPDDIENITQLKQLCYAKNWVVYCEKPFSDSGSLMKYLGSYSHRVALSNNRILSHSNGKVTFSYKDYKSAGITRNITLKADEFIRRFLQHVLPTGFYKVRYFGFMAMRNMSTKLEQCFALISKDSYLPVLVGLKSIEVWRHITNRDPLQCAKCKTGKMKVVHTIIVNKDWG
jgi:predicted Zn-ribbon and HTH transcriptional regulator